MVKASEAIRDLAGRNIPTDEIAPDNIKFHFDKSKSNSENMQEAVKRMVAEIITLENMLG